MQKTATATAADDIADEIGACFADPLRFVLIAFDWGQGELADEDGPDAWQSGVLQDIADNVLTVEQALRIAVASGHGVGKSALVAWIILWFMSTRAKCAGVVTANTQSQLTTKTWRELSVWHKRAVNADWFAWTATKFYQVEHPEDWYISAIPWSENNSEAFAGLHARDVLVIYDEASAVADAIWEVSEGAMTTPGAIWCVFGNPTRNTGRFRECWRRFRHRWITRQIDSRTAKMANRKQIDQWVEDYGEDSDFVKVRVRGLFPSAASNQFIGSDIVDSAREREPSKGYGARVMGVDVARFGDDQNCIVIRRGDLIEHIERWRETDTMQTSARVMLLADQWEPGAIFVDGVGVGGGVVDRCNQLGYGVLDVNGGSRPDDMKKYFNRRAEMWGRMRDWLKAGGCLPSDQELADDLIAPEYAFTPKNAIILEKKEDMKKRGLPSPDAGDSLALTFAANVLEPDEQWAFEREMATYSRDSVTGY